MQSTAASVQPWEPHRTAAAISHSPPPIRLSGQTNYVGEFFHTGQPELNVTFNGMLRVSEATAKLGPIPRTRTFEGMNLIETLTILSKEEHQSWSLSRVWPTWVAKNNKQFIDQHMGPPPWPHPETPCYVVFWRPPSVRCRREAVVRAVTPLRRGLVLVPTIVINFGGFRRTTWDHVCLLCN
jgi:hypothetical protein